VAAKPTRRVVLVAAATLPFAAAASGCDGVKVVGTPPSPAPEVTTLGEAIAAEQLMVDRYTAVLRNADVTLARALQPLLDEHRAHLAQLRSRLIVPAGSRYRLPGSPAHSSPAVPAAAGADVAFLRSAEQAAAAAMLDRLRRAPAALAQLFASISASEATHVPALDAAAGRAAP
jgi:hypothetical protein